MNFAEIVSDMVECPDWCTDDHDRDGDALDHHTDYVTHDLTGDIRMVKERRQIQVGIQHHTTEDVAPGVALHITDALMALPDDELSMTPDEASAIGLQLIALADRLRTAAFRKAMPT